MTITKIILTLIVNKGTNSPDCLCCEHVEFQHPCQQLKIEQVVVQIAVDPSELQQQFISSNCKDL